MMKRLTTEIAIDASPEQVWAVLADLNRYSSWNPFIVEAHGGAVSGATLHLRMSPPGGRAIALKPRVTSAVPGEVLEWLGRLAVPGLFAGRHRFELHRTATGTRLVHSETFTGILVPFLARSLDAHTLPGFTAMNEALKVEVETASMAIA
jgi:hypothetical protein